MNDAQPKRIVYSKGKLVMADGSSLTKYLKAQAKKKAFKDGDFINIITYENLKRIYLDLWLSRNMGC